MVWPEESIKHLVDECAEKGLVFDVVESIPVTEEIKLGLPERDRHIENYCESIRRCAKYGIKCVTYNFMPVFDWTRTQLDKMAPDGSTSLVMYWDQMKNLDPLKDDIHLPGWDSSYTQDEVRRPDSRLRQARRGRSLGEHRVFPQARHSGRRGMRRRNGSPSG